MKQLDNTIIKNGFTYELVKRNSYKAIYKQLLDGEFISYEIFFIKVLKPSICFGKDLGLREKFPSNEDFGYTAWSTRDYNRACEIYNNIEEKIIQDEVQN